MAQLKTKKNDASVNDFLQAIDDKIKREVCLVFKLIKQVAKEEPKIWALLLLTFVLIIINTFSKVLKELIIAAFNYTKSKKKQLTY